MSDVEVKPLPKDLYDRAKKLNVTKIYLEFSGGSDEGHMHVRLEQSLNTGRSVRDNVGIWYSPKVEKLEQDVMDWMETTWHYGGGGDGRDYGDDLTYDLVENTVSTSSWHYERQDTDLGEEILLIEREEEMPTALDLLEEILGMTEPLKDQLASADYERFREICAKTADLREGTEV